MHSILSSSALVGLLSAVDFVAAAPTWTSPSVSVGSPVIPSGTNPAVAFPSGKVFPLPNQFPGNQSLKDIQLQALGTLPNGTPPPNITDDDLTSFKFINFNEVFEVAFFTELLFNITNNVTNYTFTDPVERIDVLEILSVVQAQEELHALNAAKLLQSHGQAPIEPCLYNFPVADFPSAIALASTFTDVVLGTLQEVTTLFGKNGGDDFNFIRGVASVIGQEGEQNGFYRFLQGKVPSALPFLTTSQRDFAFTAIQNFVVPGSCPNINTINLTTFQPLALNNPLPIAPGNQTLSFTAKPNSTTKANYQGNYGGVFVVLINQQNKPIVLSPSKTQLNGDETVTIEINFPYTANELNGLTIVAVVSHNSTFTTVDDVAAATLFAPAFVEIN